MDIKEIIKNLEHYNNWRRDNDNEYTMPEPKQVGITIDAAISELNKLLICDVVQPEANCKITCLITYWTFIDSGHAMIDDYRTKVSRIVEVDNLSDLNDKYNNLVDVKVLK